MFSQSPREIQKWTFLKMSNFKFCSTLGKLKKVQISSLEHNAVNCVFREIVCLHKKK